MFTEIRRMLKVEIPKEKMCKKCKTIKPMKRFKKCSDMKDNRENVCLDCYAVRSKELRELKMVDKTKYFDF